jgi:hypothetical protein
MNGTNHQPPSLLTVGPLTLTVYSDLFYAYQFSHPLDHTIFPTTVAPRHNEIGLNLAMVGFDVTGLPDVLGRVYLQYGEYVVAIAGQDPSLRRGFYAGGPGQLQVLQYVNQAAAGYHFHWLHGVNSELGIFPSYIALESYLPEENWNYTHTFLSDLTPYYFSGMRNQLFLTQRLKLELWLVNGWETFTQWHEARSGGYLVNWRPTEQTSFTHTIYVGQDDPNDSARIRYYTDNYAQWEFVKNPRETAAVALVADAGFENATSRSPHANMAGSSLSGRLAFANGLALAARAGLFYDPQQVLLIPLPTGAPLPTGRFLGWDLTGTVDYWPSPWLVVRLEYIHRQASIPYFSGTGGISGPTGIPPLTGPPPVPDLLKHDDRLLFNVTMRL